ncbi:uncharacterized protein [Centroberyx affinis]|uniref:uncharacterized protein n=1 Tax=Centroberyx affinis TaxID=166261 RepID=UPI003A5C5748
MYSVQFILLFGLLLGQTARGPLRGISAQTTSPTTMSSTIPSATSATSVDPNPPADTTVSPLIAPPVSATSPPVSATSPPVRATSPPVSATSADPLNPNPSAVNVILPGLNTTSSPLIAPLVNATSPPVSATSPPDSTTSPPVRATSPPVSTTSPPVSATSPPVSATSADPLNPNPSAVNVILPGLNTTSSPLIAPLVSATSPPVSATSPPDSTTSPPVSATSPPVSATSSPVNATSSPVRATSSPVNATSPPVSATSSPVNATSPPVSATSSPVSATSPPVSATSSPVSATSPPVSATSPPVSATSPPVSATFAPIQEAVFNLKFNLERVFTETLAHTTSADYLVLSNEVVSMMNYIGNAAFGRNYSRSRINGYSPGSGSVVVDADLIFNDVSSISASDVAAAIISVAPPDFRLNTSSVVVTRVTSTQAPSSVTTPDFTSATLDLTTIAYAEVKLSSSMQLMEDDMTVYIEEFLRQIGANALGPLKVTVKRVARCNGTQCGDEDTAHPTTFTPSTPSTPITTGSSGVGPR